MTSNGLLKITIKLVGLATLITAGIDAAQSLPLAMTMDEELIPGGSLPFAVAYLMPVVLGLLLWLAPAAIANTIISPDPATDEQTQLINQLELIAIRILGLYFLYQSLTAMFSLYLSYKEEVALQLDASGYELTLMVLSFQMSLAIGLILGARGLQSMINKIRYSAR